ncbi:MAG: hypothetical protein EPO51_16545 [Phenylobacterium sp.]|uniref:hypothetical protein n=1 Tax=Phenylobacterium sp. TaxID=1871053 RepID=UPI00120DBDBE|nr:hypothetical protein [Phenylobacterium sp.]TAJ70698.1 MAG: hypothetical protein EPO51_16545 [Phenylobacterium sp.]
MRPAFAPLALIVLSVAAVAAFFAFAPADGTPLLGAILFACVGGYFFGTDWWILQLGRAPAPTGSRWRRVAGILALAAPATIWTVTLFAAIVVEGDNMWMVLPSALTPGLVVWPFAIGGLRRILTATPEGSPTRQVG